MAPLVSIIIPCYNAGNYVAGAIESALAQSYGRVEVIVIDDGSSDNSLEVIAGYGGRIRYESGPNRGGCAARNRGIALARGEWIQFLDADDLLLPEAIRDKLDADGDDRQTVTCSRIEYMPGKLSAGEAGGPACWLLDTHDIDTLLEHGGPQTAAPLHRKEDLLKVGGFREGLSCAQDLDLHLRLAAELGMRFVSIGATGVRIRPHSGSLSRSAGWRMHVAIAETLLHAAPILQAQGRLSAERSAVIAERAVAYARRAAHMGAMDQAAEIVAKARKLSRSWHRRAYARPMTGLLVAALGFKRYEGIIGVLRGRDSHQAVQGKPRNATPQR